jgi:hypothetical protein
VAAKQIVRNERRVADEAEISGVSCAGVSHGPGNPL